MSRATSAAKPAPAENAPNSLPSRKSIRTDLGRECMDMIQILRALGTPDEEIRKTVLGYWTQTVRNRGQVGH